MLGQLIRECNSLYGVYRSHGVQALNSADKGPIETILAKLNGKKFSRYLNQTICKSSQDKIHFMNVLQCPKQSFSISVFVLNKNTLMPLHDHPHMLVASKVLSGKGFKDTYTLNEHEQLQLSFPELYHRYRYKQVNIVRQEPSQVQVKDHNLLHLEAGQTVWTSPFEDNIHSFQNTEDELFAFIDVLVPYYDFQERYCNFYEKTELPDALKITGVPEHKPQYQTMETQLDLDQFFDQ